MEKKLKKHPVYNTVETIQLALEALQQALAMDLRSEEVEVIMVNAEHKQVTKLTNEEVDGHLNAIAERD